VIVGCALGELTVAAQRIPALGPGSLREDPGRYRAVRQGHYGKRPARSAGGEQE
jgi:hypothetical protein